MRVLVVENDLVVGMRAGVELRDAGHEVDVAPTGSDAVAVLSDASVRIDVVVIDFGLPDMTGVALMAEAAARRPDAAVVVTHASDAVVAPGCDVALHKPYGACELAQAVEAGVAARAIRRLHRSRMTGIGFVPN